MTPSVFQVSERISKCRSDFHNQRRPVKLAMNCESWRIAPETNIVKPRSIYVGTHLSWVQYLTVECRGDIIHITSAGYEIPDVVGCFLGGLVIECSFSHDISAFVIQKRGRPLLPHSHAFDVGLRGGQPYPAAGRHGWRMEKLTLNYERLRDKGPAPRRECGRTCTCNAFCLSIDRGMTFRLLSLLPGRHPCRAVLGDRYEGFQPLNSFDLSFCVRPLQIPVYLIVPPRTHLYM